jgi:4a-hydroxytetrahydrobiopterin dehydratase
MTSEPLIRQKCVPCEGGVPRLSQDEIQSHLKSIADWEYAADPDRIRKSWVVKNFMAGLQFFHAIAALAEDEGHHPDLHLVGYRKVTIEIWTHAIQGLSLNDFILAAKIDALPVELKAN